MSSIPGTRLGIISGSGPEAGLDLWAKILEENRSAMGTAFRGDIDAPHVTVLSVPGLGYSMDLPTTKDQVWASLRGACEQIASQVDVFAIACNTLYCFEQDIHELDLPAVLRSPVDAVSAMAAERELRSIGFLGAGPVMDLESGHSPYSRLQSDIALEVPADPERLHGLISAIKLAGGGSPQIESDFAEITSAMSADTAVLACTELPLLRAEAVEIELIDVTRLLARDMVCGDHSR